MTLRTRNAALTLKIESTPGTFDAPSTTTEGILVERPTLRANNNLINTDEVTGSLDGRGPIVGGQQFSIDFSLYLKGGGTPGVAPEWGKIARICGLAETATLQTLAAATYALTDATTLTDSGSGLAALTVGTVFHLTTAGGQSGECRVATSAAGTITFTRLDTGTAFVAETAAATWTIRYGVVGTLATAGTTSGFTAQAPFAATLSLYRGMPLLLSVNPVTPEFTLINDYTAARVGRIVKTMGAALDNTTRLSIPANVRYQPTSSSIPAGSLEVYMDGVRWRFTGVRGTMRVEATAGGVWRANVSLQGLFVTKTDAAVPTPTYDGTRPGIWRSSRFGIDRSTIALRNFGFDLGNRLEFPGDPNLQEGFASPEIVSREITAQANPYLTVVATRDYLDTLREATDVLVDASVLGNAGASPGNRLGFVAPTATLTAADPGADGGFVTEQLGMFLKGQDAGFMLSLW